MKIRVTGFLNLRGAFASRPDVDLPEGSTLRDLLEILPPDFLKAVEERKNDPGSVRKQGVFAILVNGVHYTHLPEGLATRLEEDDQVAFFPPIAGG